jgi:hypothetical protein
MITWILFYNQELVKTTQAENLAAATQTFALWLERKFAEKNVIFAIGEYQSSFQVTGFTQKQSVKNPYFFAAILCEKDVDFVELFDKNKFGLYVKNAADFQI